MTVSSQIARNDYTGNGVTVQFPVTFRFLQNSQLKVQRTIIATGVTTILTLDAVGADGYAVSGAQQPSGGQVTMNVAPAIGTRLSILRNVPITQETDYLANDAFPAESHEQALDKLTMIAQQQAEVTGRAIVLPSQTVGVSTELPGVVPLNLLRWNAAGTALENAAPPAIATVADGAVVDATVSPIAGIQSSKLANTQPFTGAVPRTVQAKLAEMLSVKDFGAVGDGVADDYAIIQGAINNAPGGATIYLPPGAYRVSAGLVVPAGKSLVGTSEGDAAIFGRSQITGDLGVATIVTLDGAPAAESTAIRNLCIGRAAGSIPVGCTGLEVKLTDNAVIEDVTIYRQYYGVKASGQVGNNFNRVNTTQCTRAHVLLSSVSVEMSFNNCRFGRNGGQDLACFTIIEVEGASVDTVNFIRCQFNQTGQMAVRGVYLNNYTSPNGIFNFIGCHIENISAAFIATNATPAIDRFNITACTIHLSPTTPLISSVAGSVRDLTISGCSSLDCSLAIDQGSRYRITGNTILGPVSLVSGNGVFSNNVVGGDLALSGVFTSMVVSGNDFYNGGTVLDTSTGMKSVFGNTSSVEAVTLELVNSMHGRYAKLGDSLPFAVKRVTGTTDGSGVAILTHGIPNGNLAILFVQAFYRGSTGELRPMVFEFSGANDLRVSGGTATVACRVDIIYTNPANRQNW